MDNYMAQIMSVSFNFAPKYWALCNGQLLSINANQALFSLLGTTYGGNGVQTFGLPNLQGRGPLGTGNSVLGSFQPGQMAGTPTATMLSNNMPPHTHSFMANNTAATVALPSGATLSQTAVISSFNANMFATSANAIMSPNALSTTGNNTPFSILQPYLTINYIIALSGIFPSRN